MGAADALFLPAASLHRLFRARLYALDVPNDPAVYTYKHWISDAIDVLDHLKVDKAHIVGLSMGGYTVVQLGINHPSRALSLTAAGRVRPERDHIEEFRKNALATAALFEKAGSAEVVRTYGLGAPRIPFLLKDPRGFADFNTAFASHDAQGSAHHARVPGRTSVALRFRSRNPAHQCADVDRCRR
jgi:proline iminopeptidase